MSKYNSVKFEYNGRTFDSKKEAKRYKILVEMEDRGIISDLECQVRFVLIPKMRDEDGNAVRECAYKADFVYKQEGKIVVEDVKGYRTPEYVIKKKLMLKEHGITVREV